MADRRILVRRPSPLLAAGEVSYIDRTPVDVDLALDQWRTYVDVFRRTGWDVVELPPLDEHPDGVFVEDNVFVFDDLAVLARAGVASRRAEVDGLASLLAELGLHVAQIEAPATLDGGDLLQVGSTVYGGRSARTDTAGLDQLRRFVGPWGGTVVEVPVTAALHLKSCLTALPDGTIVGYEPLVDDASVFERIRFVPEESGAHVVDLGDGRVLLAASCPTTAELYTELGFDVVTVDISEFERLEGCVTCLSVRLHDGID